MKLKIRKGSALIVVIAVISVLMILAIALIQITESSYVITNSYDKINRVNTMAQSGIDLALDKIKDTKEIPDDNIPLGSMDNSIDLNVNFIKDKVYNYETSNYKDAPGKVTLESIAKYKIEGKPKKTIRVVLNKTTTSKYKTIDIKNAVYAKTDITTKNKGYIEGDIASSLSKDSLNINKGTIITGEIIGNVDLDYPSIVIPDKPNNNRFNWKTETIKVTDKKKIKTITNYYTDESGYYDDFPDSDTLEIRTNNKDINIWIDDLTLKTGSKIVKTGSGNVNIYILNSITINNSAEINGNIYLNCDLSMKNSATINGNIFSLGTNLVFDNGTTQFNGIIYAPNADIEVKNSGETKGAIIGKTVNLKAASRIIYDPKYANIKIQTSKEDGENSYTIESYN